MARAWNHRRCSSHVSVPGAGRVCILPGQLEGEVVAFAEAMVAAAAATGRRIAKPGAARRVPSGEQLRHSYCSGHIDGRSLGFGRLCRAPGQTDQEVLAFGYAIAEARLELERAIAARVAGSAELGAAGGWVPMPAQMAPALESWSR